MRFTPHVISTGNARYCSVSAKAPSGILLDRGEVVEHIWFTRPTTEFMKVDADPGLASPIGSEALQSCDEPTARFRSSEAPVFPGRRLSPTPCV